MSTPTYQDLQEQVAHLEAELRTCRALNALWQARVTLIEVSMTKKDAKISAQAQAIRNFIKRLIDLNTQIRKLKGNPP